MRAAGVDVGASKIDVVFEDDSILVTERWPTSELTSLEQVLERLWLRWGAMDSLCIAAAGRPRPDGTIRLTNVDWPVFDPRTSGSLCKRVILVNDVQAAVAAVPGLEPHEQRDLLDVEPMADYIIAVAVSTGVNASNGQAAETGHSTWQPWDALSQAYLNFLQARHGYGSPVSVEDAISGDRGFDALFDFMQGQLPPSKALRDLVGICRTRKEPIGELITATASRDSNFAFAKACMDLWGPILGQYLRNMALAYLPQGGTIWLCGGIAQGEGVMDLTLKETDFRNHFRGGAAKMRDLMEQIALKVVVNAPDALPLTVRGALALAKTA